MPGTPSPLPPTPSRKGRGSIARSRHLFASMILLIEQLLNGAQFGVMLFLMAAGLTLIFGIMNLINLAHGSLYMIGAYIAAASLRGDALVPAGTRQPRSRARSS